MKTQIIFLNYPKNKRTYIYLLAFFYYSDFPYFFTNVIIYMNFVMHVVLSGIWQFCVTISYWSTGPQLSLAPTPL